jgi:hypothetical protein
LIPAYSLVDLIDGGVFVSYFFSTPGAENKKTANLHQAAVNCSP